MAYFNFSEIDNTTAEPELKICSGNLSDYDWSDFTPRRFLEEVQKRSDEAETCAGKKMPGTLDELLAVCRENPADAVLTENLKVKDMYCGRETAEFYNNKYDGEGFRMMELRYYDCDPESDIIFFKFPYTEKRQFACTFDARIFVNNPLTFNRILRRLYGYNGPVLVYGEWEMAGGLMASVDSDNQIIRL